jgi:hypothetical protein
MITHNILRNLLQKVWHDFGQQKQNASYLGSFGTNPIAIVSDAKKHVRYRSICSPSSSPKPRGPRSNAMADALENLAAIGHLEVPLGDWSITTVISYTGWWF